MSTFLFVIVCAVPLTEMLSMTFGSPPVVTISLILSYTDWLALYGMSSASSSRLYKFPCDSDGNAFPFTASVLRCSLSTCPNTFKRLELGNEYVSEPSVIVYVAPSRSPSDDIDRSNVSAHSSIAALSLAGVITLAVVPVPASYSATLILEYVVLFQSCNIQYVPS